jgi:hypothetical protein
VFGTSSSYCAIDRADAIAAITACTQCRNESDVDALALRDAPCIRTDC